MALSQPSLVDCTCYRSAQHHLLCGLSCGNCATPAAVCCGAVGVALAISTWGSSFQHSAVAPEEPCHPCRLACKCCPMSAAVGVALLVAPGSQQCICTQACSVQEWNVQVTWSVKLPLCKYEFKPGSCVLSVWLSILCGAWHVSEERFILLVCGCVWCIRAPQQGVCWGVLPKKPFVQCFRSFSELQDAPGSEGVARIPISAFILVHMLYQQITGSCRPVKLHQVCGHASRHFSVLASACGIVVDDDSGLRVSLPLRHAAACWCAHHCPTSSGEYMGLDARHCQASMAFGRTLLPGIGNPWPVTGVCTCYRGLSTAPVFL